MLDIKVGIELPRRVAEAERVGRRPLPITWQQVQLGADVLMNWLKGTSPSKTLTLPMCIGASFFSKFKKAASSELSRVLRLGWAITLP
ncbi:MAG: hypothetical protein ACJ74J_17990 [Blastocatellia bacterium]